jgi:folylpolyglutamate synthase
LAGTKGKGTTCYYLNQILVEHQKITGKPKKIGCLTSPHKMEIRERYLINNEKVSKPLFSYYVRLVDSTIRSLSTQKGLQTPPSPRFPAFAFLVGMTMFYFENVDLVVLETGMGGETDSTNIFPHPVATGITSIGIDHVHVLGHTREQIAWHKAGIFKQGSPAATVEQDEVVLEVLRKRAEERHVDGKLQVITDEQVLKYGIKVDPDMSYQRSNAALGLFLAETYLKSVDPYFEMTANLARSVQDVKLLGRAEVLKDRDRTWFVNSAVNDISLKEAVSWFKGSVQRSG